MTDPGKHWDRALTEPCEGKRGKPVWGISTADFHEDGRLGLKLGAFPTRFLVRDFSKVAILNALRQGRITYYRLIDSMKHLTSNPIFVKRQN